MSAGFSSLAVTPGDRVSYSTRETAENCTKFTVNSDGKTFEGSCIEMGVEVSPGGTATVGSPSTKMKKIAYYYGEVLGYWGSTQNGGHILERSGALYSEETVVMYLLQAESQGYQNWKSICGSTGWMVLDERSCDAVINLLENTNWDSINLPSGFQMYTLDCGNDQNGCIWYYSTDGDLTIKKNVEGSSNQSFTFTVKVSGAAGTYSGVNFNNGTATVTVRGGETKKIEGLPDGASYSVTETNIPSGWSLVSKSNDTGTIVGGENKTATFTNKQYGKIKLRKASANTSITG